MALNINCSEHHIYPSDVGNAKPKLERREYKVMSEVVYKIQLFLNILEPRDQSFWIRDLLLKVTMEICHKIKGRNLFLESVRSSFEISVLV